jgi:recombinational DNA repair ATPase RecF
MEQITLHNWRRFESQKFYLPKGSFTIVDSNGQGKTSLLCAVYSLFTKKPFPSTKPVDHLKAGTSYFGITTNHQDWFYNAQLGTNGRLKTTYSKPTTSIEIFGQTIPDHESWPKILTYLPTDNYWLYQPRSQKMGILDELLGQIFEKEYEDNLKKLTKVIESKNRIIRHYRETGDTGDKTLIKILEADLVKYSLAIWKLRQKFFVILQQNLPEFSDWIQSDLVDWKISWSISDPSGERRVIDLQKEIVVSELDEYLWVKELQAGKVLFGANRDDFVLKSKHLNMEKVLSRGEMRLFVLFVKSLIKSPKLNPQSKPIWWFLDDIFNELDSTRETILYQQILDKSAFTLSTGTKSAAIKLPSYSLKTLTEGSF